MQVVRVYDVRIECNSGTLRHSENPLRWEFVLNRMTWCVEESYDAARATLQGLLDGDPARKNIRRGWINEREA